MAQPRQISKRFTSLEKATKFANWIKNNTSDSDYGYPIFQDLEELSKGNFFVTYTTEKADLIHGVAIGCEL